MAFATFEQDVFIAATPEIVCGFLAEMNNRSELHPFILEVQHIKTTTTPEGIKVDYFCIRDRMKVGPFTIDFTYRANMRINAPGEFDSDAYQSPGIHIHNVTTCQAEGSGSLLKERLGITAPRPLMKTTYAATVSSHKLMIASLKKLAEDAQQATI